LFLGPAAVLLAQRYTSSLWFDYTLSLASLESYANRNLLVEGVQVEQILLHNEPLTQIINETNHVYSAQSCLIEDRVSKLVLVLEIHYQQCPMTKN
jgi:hypothetical protein